MARFDNYLDKHADLKKQWCWIFINLATFVRRPDNLDSSFDDIIKDAGTRRLTTDQKIKYMEALHLNERERTVIYEGGIIMGREEGRAEGTITTAKKLIAEYGLSPEDVARSLGIDKGDLL